MRLPFALLIALPLAANRKLFGAIWAGAQPRAWDGAGHYGLAQVFDRAIFPGTFGWTRAYFAGMPLPNFYTPLFYYCVALLHHLHLASFANAFKLMVVIPELLLPVAVWRLAARISDDNSLVGLSAGFACLPLLADFRFVPRYPAGLDYFSTFEIGLYTQPLGFLALTVWYISFLRAVKCRQFAFSSILLALTILANFFDAVTALLFAAVHLAVTCIRLLRSRNAPVFGELLSTLTLQVGSLFVAALLSLFWLGPVFLNYKYFVTKPDIISLPGLMTPALVGWYVVSLVGVIFWLRRPTRQMWSFLVTCIVVSSIVIFARRIAPPWFPLQAPRFLAQLNLLLAVPVGHAVSTAVRAMGGLPLAALVPRNRSTGERTHLSQNATALRTLLSIAIALFLIVDAFLFVKPSPFTLAFYASDKDTPIQPVLRFASQHTDGRYLVETPPPYVPPAAFDGRALDSYLGSQGNESLNLLFREASPNSIFFTALTNAFSVHRDNFGISSSLADDLDFLDQPLSRHLERARFVGTKYIVVASPILKQRLTIERDMVHDIRSRIDLGPWTLFELRGSPGPTINIPAFRPALVVSSFSLKLRRANQFDFLRLAEEQFADGWFEVLLALSPESRIDRIDGLQHFGTLILDTYECDDDEVAFQKLRLFSQEGHLLLLPRDATLFRRIANSKSQFPLATVVERPAEEEGLPLLSASPTSHYDGSSARKIWKAIKGELDQFKIPTSAGTLNASTTDYEIRITLSGSKSNALTPVLISTTYFPDWARTDGASVFVVTPFFMLTFVDKSAEIVYGRGRAERTTLWISLIAIVVLFLSIVWDISRPVARNRRTPSPSP